MDEGKPVVVRGQAGTAVEVPEDHKHPVELHGPAGQKVVVPANVPVPIRLEVPTESGLPKATAMASMDVKQKIDPPAPPAPEPPAKQNHDRLVHIAIGVGALIVLLIVFGPRLLALLHGG